MYNHIFEPKAQKEYEDSIEWYSARSLVAAVKFIDSVDELIALICYKPNQFKKPYKNYHEAITETYPFSIIYCIEEKIKTIVIISVYHNKRSPKRKFKS
jgi:plasmid stabilization system protein ParE